MMKQSLGKKKLPLHIKKKQLPLHISLEFNSECWWVPGPVILRDNCKMPADYKTWKGFKMDTSRKHSHYKL